MKIGVFEFCIDKSVDPAVIAKRAEELGFDSYWVPEHAVIPIKTSSPYPASDDGKIPDEYGRITDPFVSLARASAVTKTIELGTGICLIPERNPLELAKEVATLDNISNGRFIFGIGAGWNKPEIENHGTAFEKRWAVLRERILAMKTIWTEDEAEYHGEFVNFDPIWSYPKPVQTGGPPIWIGANSKYVADRVAEFADGWLPIGGRAGGANIDQVREACEKRGRSFGDITLALFFPPMDEGKAREKIELGYSELIFNLPSEGADKVLPVLDDIAALADKLRG